MDLTLELRLTAALGTLGLGFCALAGSRPRARNRVFGYLCIALSTWNLGVLDPFVPAPFARGFRAALFLIGMCAAVPLAQQFALRVRRPARSLRKVLAAGGYLIAATLWLSSWTALFDIHPHWNVIAAVCLGAIVVQTTALLGEHVRSLPRTSERSAYRLLTGGLFVALAGGLSGLIPFEEQLLPWLRPASGLTFSVLASSVAIRHGFLDLAARQARALAVLNCAILSGSFLYVVTSLWGIGLLPLLLASGIILLLSQPVWNFLGARRDSSLAGSNPVTRGLLHVSRSLTRAQDRVAMMNAVREGRRLLPEDVQLGFYLRRGGDEPFHIAYKVGRGPIPSTIPENSPLLRYVVRERAPVTKRLLAEEIEETRGGRQALAQVVFDEMRELGSDLIVPVFHGDRLTGFLSLGGDVDPRYLTPELTETFLAVSNQAMESLERIEALERARQRESLAAVGEMAAGLAHEIRNPVTAIRGAAELLLEEGEGSPDEKRAAEMLEVIQEETIRLGRVVSDFLEYARPRARGRRAVDLEDELRRARRAAEAAGMGLAGKVRVEPGTPRVVADAEQLQRIFRNLIWNAREAAGPDGSLNVKVAHDGADRVSIRFEDNGRGIHPSEIPRLFQPFHTTKPEGTGLGLALVHRLVEAHDGEVQVDGRPGRGAVFTIYLPAGVRT